MRPARRGARCFEFGIAEAMKHSGAPKPTTGSAPTVALAAPALAPEPGSASKPRAPVAAAPALAPEPGSASKPRAPVAAAPALTPEPGSASKPRAPAAAAPALAPEPGSASKPRAPASSPAPAGNAATLSLHAARARRSARACRSARPPPQPPVVAAGRTCGARAAPCGGAGLPLSPARGGRDRFTGAALGGGGRGRRSRQDPAEHPGPRGSAERRSLADHGAASGRDGLRGWRSARGRRSARPVGRRWHGWRRGCRESSPRWS